MYIIKNARESWCVVTIGDREVNLHLMDSDEKSDLVLAFQSAPLSSVPNYQKHDW
jgi:hypothetical protein